MPSVSHGWYFLRFAPPESAYVFLGSPAVSGSGHAAFDILLTHLVFAGGILTFFDIRKKLLKFKTVNFKPTYMHRFSDSQ